MRVFKLSDGTSWMARLQDPLDAGSSAERAGWETILFEHGAQPAAQRLVYRPPGWLDLATAAELAAALEEGVPVRIRWGG